MWQKSTIHDLLGGIAHATIVVSVAVTVQVLFSASILVVLGAGDWGTALVKFFAGNL